MAQRGKRGGPVYPLRWEGKQRPAGRYGQACRKTGQKHGQMVRVEFSDGHSFIVDPKLLRAR